ncbi:uncharacterized protein [Haliotis cracherodii]|uniref:uncharacterized protein n=1 Tax=Haliotis cracherodii TaxID=6455 RepID=UPI0039E8BD41
MEFHNVPACCLSMSVYFLWISISRGAPVLTSLPDPPTEGALITLTCTEDGALDPDQVVWYRNDTDKKVRPTSKNIIFNGIVKDLNISVNNQQFSLSFLFRTSQEKDVPWRCVHQGVPSNTITLKTAVAPENPATATPSDTTDLSNIYTLAGVGAAVIVVTIIIVIIAATRGSRSGPGDKRRRRRGSSLVTAFSDRRTIDMVNNDMYRTYLGHSQIPKPRVWQDNFTEVYSQVIKPRYNDYQYSLGRMGHSRF